MSKITESELDTLLAELSKLQPEMKSIQEEVIAVVRHDLLKKTLVAWLKLIGVCFGVPLAVMVYGFVLYQVMDVLSFSKTLKVVCMVVPMLITLLAGARRVYTYQI